MKKAADALLQFERELFYDEECAVVCAQISIVACGDLVVRDDYARRAMRDRGDGGYQRKRLNLRGAGETD